MGRVKRYTKIKACDPFAKKSNANVIDYKHDQPPDKYEKKVKRRNKLLLSWEDEEDREILLQQTALREMKTTNVAIPKIEGKKEEETMREFKTRIRMETKKTLLEQSKKKSTTAVKRKNHLIEKKKLKKLKKLKLSDNFDNYQVIEEDYVDFTSMSADEEVIQRKKFVINEPIKEFKKPEVIQFNERVDRPPDISKYQFKSNSNNKRNRLIINEDSGLDNHNKKSLSEITSDVLDDNAPIKKSFPLTSNNINAKSTTTKNDVNYVNEMEALRDRVKQAYQIVKLKRIEARKK